MLELVTVKSVEKNYSGGINGYIILSELADVNNESLRAKNKKHIITYDMFFISFL